MGVRPTMSRRLSRLLEWAGLPATAILIGVIISACLAPGTFNLGTHEQATSDAQGELLLGQGTIEEHGATFSGLDQRGRAMVVFRPSSALVASSKPFVHLSTDRIPSRFQLSFFWRRQDEPRNPARTPLGQPSGKLTAYLGDHPDWRGEVIEYGVLLEAIGPFPPRNTEVQSISVSTPQLVSGGFSHRMAAVLDGLLQPWYWAGSAPNTIARPNPDQRYGMIPFAFSALCGVTFVLLYCIANLGHRKGPTVLEAMTRGVVLSVLVLAILHTKQILDQTRSHIETYSEPGDGLRQDSGPDWPIQNEAQEIRDLLEIAGIGKAGTEKIAIITPGNQYRHERLFYHLLPRNTYPSEDIRIACKRNTISLLVIDQQGRNTLGVTERELISNCTARGRVAGTIDDKWTVYRLDE